MGKFQSFFTLNVFSRPTSCFQIFSFSYFFLILICFLCLNFQLSVIVSIYFANPPLSRLKIKCLSLDYDSFVRSVIPDFSFPFNLTLYFILTRYCTYITLSTYTFDVQNPLIIAYIRTKKSVNNKYQFTVKIIQDHPLYLHIKFRFFLLKALFYSFYPTYSICCIVYCTYTTVHASPPPACAGGMCAAFHLNAANTSLDLFWILDAVRCQEFTSFNAELRPFDMSFRQGG